MNKKLKQLVFEKFNGRCAYTGKPLESDWQVDHMESKYLAQYKMGLDYTQDEINAKVNDISNLMPTCRIINHYKRSLGLEGFRIYMRTFHHRLAKLPKNTKVPATQRRKEYL